MEGSSPQTLPTAAAVWQRPGLDAGAFLAGAPGLDTALFDVDGVLIDTRRSYRLAVMHGAERLVRTITGRDDVPSPMVTQDDIAHFKLAGGFNNDWHATQLFAALWTARLREWRGQPEAAVSIAEWAEQASAAARAGRGGVTWMRATFPASAIPEESVARWAHDEYYWGAALVRELHQHEPLYAPEASGFVHNEELLLDPTVLPLLVRHGIHHLGLITGRVGPEIGWAVRRLAEHGGLPEGLPPDALAWHDSVYGRSPFASIIPGTQFVKPDPLALAHAVRHLGSACAFFIGDTADDLDLVLRYRRDAQPHDAALPPVLAVMVASGAEALTYQQRGADLLVEHVRALPTALAPFFAPAAG